MIIDQTSDSGIREKYFDEWMEVVRCDSKGHRGVRARKDIPRGTLIGIYSGVYTLQKTGQYIEDLVFCTDDLLAEWEWQNKRGGKGLKGMDCYRKGFSIDFQHVIILEGYGHLSPINLVKNVCARTPEGHANVKLHYFMCQRLIKEEKRKEVIKDLPVAIYFTTTDIKKGTELLSDDTNPLKGKFIRKIPKQKMDWEVLARILKKQLCLRNDSKIRYWQGEFSNGGIGALEKVMNPMEREIFRKSMMILGGFFFRDVEAIKDAKKHLNPMEWECFYRNWIISNGGMDSCLNKLTSYLTPESIKIYDFKGNELPS